MDLIDHQVIGESLNLEFGGALSQPTRKSKPIFIFAAIALPDYIVRYLGADGS
jgi:hypothetical protein